MPADDWPSFHCRPSTASTVLPASASTRQIPTTGTSDFGSAPAVSLDRSTLNGAAIAGNSKATVLTTAITSTLVPIFMSTSRRNVRLLDGKRRLRHHAKTIRMGQYANQQCRLAGAVRSNQAEDLASL